MSTYTYIGSTKDGDPIFEVADINKLVVLRQDHDSCGYHLVGVKPVAEPTAVPPSPATVLENAQIIQRLKAFLEKHALAYIARIRGDSVVFSIRNTHVVDAFAAEFTGRTLEEANLRCAREISGRVLSRRVLYTGHFDRIQVPDLLTPVPPAPSVLEQLEAFRQKIKAEEVIVGRLACGCGYYFKHFGFNVGNGRTIKGFGTTLEEAKLDYAKRISGLRSQHPNFPGCTAPDFIFTETP